MARVREPSSNADAITPLGSIEAASLLPMSFARVRNTRDMLNRQTCQGILLCLRLVTEQSTVHPGVLSDGHDPRAGKCDTNITAPQYDSDEWPKAE